MLRKISRNLLSGIPSVAVVCLLIALAPSLIAQTAGIGALTGRVTGASGDAIANGTVTVTSIDDGQIRSATTGTDGSYKFDGLPPGKYRIKFEAAGFKTVEIPSAPVDGAEAAVLDEKLDVGEPIDAKPTPKQPDNLPNAPSRVQQHLRFRIWGFLRSKPRETPVSKRCWINGHTCLRSINGWG